MKPETKRNLEILAIITTILFTGYSFGRMIYMDRKKYLEEKIGKK